MFQQTTPFRRLASALLFAALAAPAVRAQDPGPMPVPPFTPPGQSDPQQEMRELFKQVELKLREIDEVLFDAGAGEAPDGPLEDAGIDDLLRHARQQSSDAQEGIERILELARQQQQQQQSGGSQQQQQPSGQSPLDEERQQDGGERERTPDKPQQSPEPEKGDGKPEDNKPEDESRDPQNREADPPDKGETERVGGGEGSAPWGSLPIHGREVFRVKGGADLPPQYRDWIDGYHRRLQRIGGKR